MSTVCGTNVIDVTSVGARAVLSIQWMNNTIVGGSFTPALVPPEATLVRKHAGEIRVVAANYHARRCEGSAGVRIGPGSAAVRRLENEIGVIVGKTATAFIHTGDVDIA